jgi:hypothetical protein
VALGNAVPHSLLIPPYGAFERLARGWHPAFGAPCRALRERRGDSQRVCSSGGVERLGGQVQVVLGPVERAVIGRDLGEDLWVAQWRQDSGFRARLQLALSSSSWRAAYSRTRLAVRLESDPLRMVPSKATEAFSFPIRVHARLDLERLGDERRVVRPGGVVEVTHRRLDVGVAHPLLDASDVGLGDVRAGTDWGHASSPGHVPQRKNSAVAGLPSAPGEIRTPDLRFRSRMAMVRADHGSPYLLGLRASEMS